MPLPGLPGSDEFMSAYQAALAGVESKLEIGAGRGNAPDFVEVSEASIAVDDAMRHQRCLQPVC